MASANSKALSSEPQRSLPLERDSVTGSWQKKPCEPSPGVVLYTGSSVRPELTGQESSTQTLHGTASPDCRETARGSARGVNGAAVLRQSHDMECMGFCIFTPQPHLFRVSLCLYDLMSLGRVVTTCERISWTVTNGLGPYILSGLLYMSSLPGLTTYLQ